MKTQSVKVYANGVCHCSVCAEQSLTIQEMLRIVNAINPTGISSPWALSTGKTFKDGTPMPCQCDQEQDRKHYLLIC